jgi:hypothetical protein
MTTPPIKHSCPKCHFVTFRKENLIRHHALKHVRGRNSFVPRHSIKSSIKKKAIDFMNSSDATTPEKIDLIQRKFHFTPNTQNRLFKTKHFVPSKKCLFRREGAGRQVDKFWQQIESELFRRFKANYMVRQMIILK